MANILLTLMKNRPELPVSNDKSLLISSSLAKIYTLIDGIEGVTEMHKQFYKHMIKGRYNKIIQASDDLLRSRS